MPEIFIRGDDWPESCIARSVEILTYRRVLPEPFGILVSRTPSGSIIIRQGEHGDNAIIIPAEYLRAFVEGIYRTAQGE